MAEISNEMYERLRQILEKQNGRKYTSEEMKEIGNGLLEFYRLLIDLESVANEYEEGGSNSSNLFA
jgi:hypothetical protein